MYHIKDDQRSIRSAEMLYEGLAKLMREQPFLSITVTAVCRHRKPQQARESRAGRRCRGHAGRGA